MSNEEAIAIIQNEYKCVDRDCNIERGCGKCDLMMPSKEPILEAYKLAIKALEQTTWILCSERLPKIAGVYRVTRYYPNNVMNPNYIVDGCCFDGSDTWYNDNRINHERAHANNVIAWQEDPEPYRGE